MCEQWTVFDVSVFVLCILAHCRYGPLLPDRLRVYMRSMFVYEKSVYNFVKTLKKFPQFWADFIWFMIWNWTFTLLLKKFNAKIYSKITWTKKKYTENSFQTILLQNEQNSAIILKYAKEKMFPQQAKSKIKVKIQFLFVCNVHSIRCKQSIYRECNHYHYYHRRMENTA